MSESNRRQMVIESNAIADVIGEYLELQSDNDGLESPPVHYDHHSTLRIDPATRRL